MYKTITIGSVSSGGHKSKQNPKSMFYRNSETTSNVINTFFLFKFWCDFVPKNTRTKQPYFVFFFSLGREIIDIFTFLLNRFIFDWYVLTHLSVCWAWHLVCVVIHATKQFQLKTFRIEHLFVWQFSCLCSF